MKVSRNDTQRRAGVLMPVASLPSRDGIGSFGRSAYRFVDMLADMGIRIWQLLPLNPLGYGNSPYQPFSSYAGDELYVDLELLEQEGLLPPHRTAYAHPGKPGRLDYQAAKAYKEPLLHQAYLRFREKNWKDEAFTTFCAMDWVYPYAVFMALKKQNGLRCWNEWPEAQQNWILDRKYDISHLEPEIGYQMFVQYMFYSQWMALKTYANDRGLQIMGDVPFYVGIDSLDVWSSREDFLLDESWKPSFVAGVPPDYFSVTGQRWGNPIYNWENLENKKFSFWVERLRYSARLYDIIRIDHFRAFDTYWKIVASCDTAIDGTWEEAPGVAFFEELYRQLPDIHIVAEDLGDLRPQVLELRDRFGLMGMNVAEFTLLSPEVPQKHQLIYTGTHDNQTVKGWYASLSKAEKAAARRKLASYGAPREGVDKKMVRFVFQSACDLAVIPLSDLLGLDDSARLNTPGSVGSPNWEWCLGDYKKLQARAAFIREVISSSGR